MTRSKIDRGLYLLRQLKGRQLLLLLALGEGRSLRKAAASLNMTQPTATKLLQELEATIGMPLFERSRRGLVPTSFGLVMIRHAKLMRSEFSRTCEELEALSKGASGSVKIGAVISAIPFLLARAVAALKAEHPSLHVSIDVGTSDALVPALADGFLDILLARPLVQLDRPDFNYVDLVDEPLHIVARTDHPVHESTPVLRDLGQWPWTLLPSGSPMRKVLAPIFSEMRLQIPESVVETSSMMTMVALMQESDMLSVMPADVSNFYTEKALLKQVPVALPALMGSYGIITRKDRPMSPGASALVEHLKDTVGRRKI